MPQQSASNSAGSEGIASSTIEGADRGDPRAVELEAAAFRRLLSHLNNARPDVQNIDLMILAGFCRNCLADWYREAAAERGLVLSRDDAREKIYGEPFANWKSSHQTEATAEQRAAFEASRKHV